MAPYSSELLDELLRTLPPGARIAKVYYLPEHMISSEADRVPVLVPKAKAEEILRWLS
ncbi:hypothetical protein GMRT_10530 [Giardia muris]|uniref:Uncharacterized protein n=1 Tax=Giardia muris TaxID=5742 RepID=A0A4Z1SMT6_GIAMU|nr:hypothetical protein GMRT_10530 [Giardia muris]|eukprot:TNJ26890.1 hypothetical protein GMRT_10530 [Giardia muris]